MFEWKIAGDENKDFAYWNIATGEPPRGGMWRMPKEKPLGVLVHIRVADIDKTLEKVAKMGGKIVVPKSKEGENAWRHLQTLKEISSVSTNTRRNDHSC